MKGVNNIWLKIDRITAMKWQWRQLLRKKCSAKTVVYQRLIIRNHVCLAAHCVVCSDQSTGLSSIIHSNFPVTDILSVRPRDLAGCWLLAANIPVSSLCNINKKYSDSTPVTFLFSLLHRRQTNNVYDLQQEMLDWKIPLGYNYVNGKIVHPLLSLLYPVCTLLIQTTWQTFTFKLWFGIN